ncbi:uncharacterized protein BXZ73DRAFT_53796 [Epithele typhae]|uniref:uncharacterized protein n=1 Tax=Epithele typhae TaxID=378194 RepID=UPI00200750EA|nr:uncharacterized protein BXZ73DRAFT_53796 [Epithele typhae]KAH9916414.1 hypothetical protein BXZ73DRAFT_53796 [Epithele typhae]
MSLPEVLFPEIVQYLDETDLARLARASRALHIHTENLRYRIVTIRSFHGLLSFQEGLRATRPDQRGRTRRQRLQSVYVGWESPSANDPQVGSALAFILDNLAPKVRLELQITDAHPSSRPRDTWNVSLQHYGASHSHLRASSWVLQHCRSPAKNLVALTVDLLSTQDHVLHRISHAFDDTLQDLRLFRRFPSSPRNQSPIRICATLSVRSLRRLFIEDSCDGGVDVGLDDEDFAVRHGYALLPVAADGVPSLEVLVWRPAWVRSANTNLVEEQTSRYQHEIVNVLDPVIVVVPISANQGSVMVGKGGRERSATRSNLARYRWMHQ